MRRAVRWTPISLLVMAIVVVATPIPAMSLQTEICDNGVNDDGDLVVDCADPDCKDDPACDFETGCCIFAECENRATQGGGAGRTTPEPTITCFDGFTQPACADLLSGATEPGGSGATVALECPALQLVEGFCAAQPDCPGFSGTEPVPVLSALGMGALVLLLSLSGSLYLWRRGA